MSFNRCLIICLTATQTSRHKSRFAAVEVKKRAGNQLLPSKCKANVKLLHKKSGCTRLKCKANVKQCTILSHLVLRRFLPPLPSIYLNNNLLRPLPSPLPLVHFVFTPIIVVFSSRIR